MVKLSIATFCAPANIVTGPTLATLMVVTFPEVEARTGVTMGSPRLHAKRARRVRLAVFVINSVWKLTGRWKRLEIRQTEAEQQRGARQSNTTGDSRTFRAPKQRRTDTTSGGPGGADNCRV